MDPENHAARETSEPSGDEPLDSVLSDMLDALKHVREVLGHAVRSFPMPAKGKVAVSVRRTDGSTVQVPGDSGDLSR